MEKTKKVVLKIKSKDCGASCTFTKKQLGEILKWAKAPTEEQSILTTSNDKKLKEHAIKEKEWGNRMIGQKDNSQWTTNLGESLVYRILKDNDENPRRAPSKGGYRPDWETDNYIYEVKTRNWSTPGTAGEKVLGTPLKYAEIPELYGKPLKIVCVAYQEYELTYGKTPVLGKNVRKAQKKFLDFYKSNNIEILGFSDLIVDN